ncbi:MAG TPA: FAD-binding oxidoreductase [Nocardioidaceae bacterium]|jgi:FAD/FMN-containing dehydrogenase
MTIESTPAERATALRGLCNGAVHLPGDPTYEQACLAWNVAVQQRPAAVAFPANADDVSEVVRAASLAGLRVAPQGTGHNPGPLGSLEDSVLLRTSQMRGVTVDPVAGTARAEAGALWIDVVETAARHGLAALHGSSPNVGVVGYSLGGGIGWYARKLGLATNSVTAVELVLADGSQVRADAEQNRELFWAVRGGGGSFGVVTALEHRLYPIPDAYAGMLVWNQTDAEKVLRTWARWSVGAPDEVTTSFRMLNVPDIPEIPAPFRARQLAVIDGAVLADDRTAEAILAELRALEPEMDTFGRVPAAALSRLHMDPEDPTPGISNAALLRELPDPAIDAFLALTRPGSGCSLLMAELRQLDGALGRPHEGAGALPMLDGQFAFYGVGVAITPELGERARADATAIVDALGAYASRSRYLNFTEEPVDVREAYGEEAWTQLKGLRSMVDPGGVLHANHPIPRLYENGVAAG